MATQNGFEIITEVIETWNSDYNVVIGYNKTLDSFLASYSGDNDMVFISYSASNPRTEYISQEVDLIQESFIIFIKTIDGIDFVNELLSNFTSPWAYEDPIWGPRILSLEYMLPLESNSDVNYFSINLKTN